MERQFCGIERPSSEAEFLMAIFSTNDHAKCRPCRKAASRIFPRRYLAAFPESASSLLSLEVVVASVVIATAYQITMAAFGDVGSFGSTSRSLLLGPRS